MGVSVVDSTLDSKGRRMKEYIVDFELYEDGQPTQWLQQAFRLIGEEAEEFAFTQFLEYARKEWATESRGGSVRIKNIWVVEG